MKNIKNILAAVVVATAGLCVADVVTPQKVEARTTCNTVGAYRICRKDNGAYGADFIGVYRAGNEVAFMKVICTGNGGNRWEGERDGRFVSYNDMDTLAYNWCRNYN